MQFQQSGIVYTQIEIEVSNQNYSNASEIAVGRHTPIFWLKTMYYIRAGRSRNNWITVFFKY